MTTTTPAPPTVEVLVATLRANKAVGHDDCTGRDSQCPICAQIRVENAHFDYLADALPGIMAAKADSERLARLAAYLEARTGKNRRVLTIGMDLWQEGISVDFETDIDDEIPPNGSEPHDNGLDALREALDQLPEPAHD